MSERNNILQQTSVFDMESLTKLVESCGTVSYTHLSVKGDQIDREGWSVPLKYTPIRRCV